MTPIGFEVTISQSQKGIDLKKACPPNNFKILWPTVFLFGMEVSHDHEMTPIDFEVTGSKVKITWAFNSAQLR
jgi:hypothetical protein